MKKHRTLFCFLTGIFFGCNSLFGALNYTLKDSSYAFAYNVAPTYLINGGGVDVYCSCQGPGPINIGFTFQFGCVNYTTFDATMDGWMTLSNACVPFSTCVLNPDANNQLAGNAGQTANNERPIIAPLWDDLASDVNAGQGLNYKLTGLSPNRILTVEWRGMIWNASGAAATISFQVKLYETKNVVEFVYKQEAGALAGVRSASIGLGGPGNGDFYSLNNTGAAATASNAVETSNLSTRPATNQVYRWYPASCVGLPIELLYFTGKNMGNKNLLEWETATETNNHYFTIDRSKDAVNFISISTINGAGTSNSAHFYNHTDFYLPDSCNLLYYRLKQTDYNGAFVYSGIIALQVPFVTDKPPDIYFDPASDQLIVSCNFNSEKDFIFGVTDLLGRPLFQKQLYAGARGNNVFTITVSSFPGGIYFAKFSDPQGNVWSSSKFIK